MKNEHKIYAFFSFLCMLASSFFVLKLLYLKSGDVFYSFTAQAAIWANTLFWAFITFLFYKNRINRRIGNAIFSVSFIFLIFIFTVTVDRFLGLFLPGENNKMETVFEPCTAAHYKTTEFDIVARINSIGLRDKEIDIQKNDKTRILCFGDSWTFGWGVNVEQSWPKAMEKYLVDKGYPVEVINCGRGGQYTRTYKVFMRKLVPLLKPDIVIVGVLQLDDLAQRYQDQHKTYIKKRLNFNPMRSIKKAINKSYRNCIALFRLHSPPRPVEITDEWKVQSNNIIAGFNKLQAMKYDMFDDSVKQMFESGNLNPGLLSGYMWYPEAGLLFNDPNNPATKIAAGKIVDDFIEMKTICDQNNSLLIFWNLPINETTGHVVKRTPVSDTIFRGYMYENNMLDLIYSGIADKAGVPYFELTDIFKNLEPKDSFFFLYDGHPNEKGYNVIGQSIGNYLIENKFLTTEKEL